MVVLGITTIISYGTTQYLFGVLVVPIDTTFHWGRASISGAYAIGLIIAGLLGVPIGYLVDRWGARLLMSCGSALAGLALIGLARVDGIFQFYLLWSGGLGLAMALTLYPVTFTVVANWFVRKRGTALAVLTLVGGLSSPIYAHASPSTTWWTTPSHRRCARSVGRSMASATAIEISSDTERMRAAVIFGLATSPSNLDPFRSGSVTKWIESCHL